MTYPEEAIFAMTYPAIHQTERPARRRSTASAGAKSDASSTNPP
jgi:hypothetical protein